jgi:hypothetical protein
MFREFIAKRLTYSPNLRMSKNFSKPGGGGGGGGYYYYYYYKQ